MRFDSELHFQYWQTCPHRKEIRHGISELMSCIGACWMMERERFWALEGTDEAHGSWGQMGTEIACKTWLSGGKLVVNKKTWFAHLFRTQGGDFSFPYSNPDTKTAVEYSQWLWRGNNWEKATHPLSWMIEKFWPVPGWTEADFEKIKERKQ
jgi:hypothetical protein